MRLFFIALQFLTVLPLPFHVRCEERDLGRSMALFPLAGLAIGAALAGSDLLLARVFPQELASLLLVVLLTAVTGALHLDGLCDVCDGLAARGEKERFLEVMKDPRTGAAGAAAAVLSLLLRYQAIVHLPEQVRTPALLFFPMAGRFAQVLATVGAQRARSGGLGALFMAGAAWRQLACASLLTPVAAWWLLGMAGAAACAAAALSTLLLRRYFYRRLGGITGDIIGCSSEVAEIVTLLAVTALYGRL